MSSKSRGQSPIGSEGGAPGQGYLCFILPASFLGLFLILARRGYMVRRNLIFGLLALAHGVAANRALQLPSPPSSPSRGGRRLSGPACAPNASNASNSSFPNGRMVECTEFVVDGSTASNRSNLSNASNASSPHALQPSPPSPPPHPPCGCQHISVTGAESVQSKRMGIYTKTSDFVGARQLYQRGSPASQYLYYDTRCASAHVLAHATPSARPHRPPAPAHTPRLYSHSLAVAFVVAAKAGRSTRRPMGWPESTGQRARPPAHTRRMALGLRGMAAPSAATTTSRWSA